MNHLAHLLLAGDDPEAKVGQVLADFVRASEIAAFAPGIQAGIRAHQQIDSFGDSHAVFARARKRMKPPYRRFGGVLLDIYFDHFLARCWERSGDGGSLEGFADRTYRTLSDYREPTRVRRGGAARPIRRLGSRLPSVLPVAGRVCSAACCGRARVTRRQSGRAQIELKKVAR